MYFPSRLFQSKTHLHIDHFLFRRKNYLLYIEICDSTGTSIYTFGKFVCLPHSLKHNISLRRYIYMIISDANDYVSVSIEYRTCNANNWF